MKSKFLSTIRFTRQFREADASMFNRIITESGGEVSSGAMNLMESSEFLTVPSDIKKKNIHVARTMEILGECRNGKFCEIYETIIKAGGKILLPKMGPQLRVQYIGDKVPCVLAEDLYIVMNPIKRNQRIFSEIFLIKSHTFGMKKFVLNSVSVYPSLYFNPMALWAFSFD